MQISIGLWFKGCDTLKHFSQLENLSLERVNEEAKEDIAGMLESFRELTALKIVGVSMSMIPRLVDCIFSISKLKALAFRPFGPQTERQICPTPHMEPDAADKAFSEL